MATTKQVILHTFVHVCINAFSNDDRGLTIYALLQGKEVAVKRLYVNSKSACF